MKFHLSFHFLYIFKISKLGLSLRNMLLFILLIYIQTANSSLPCKFIETINITDGYKDSHHNFIFKNNKFPIGTYQVFDYVEDYAQVKISVNPHIRGCACRHKSCLRFCCMDDNDVCLPKNKFNVINEKSEEEIINISDNKYDVLLGRSCEEMYKLEDDGDFWKLFRVSKKFKILLSLTTFKQ